MRRAAALLSAAALRPAAAAAPAADFEAAVQRVADQFAAQACPAGASCAAHGHTVQLTWKDAARDFTVAAGTVHMPDGTERPCDADDNFVYGSGTKPFTAAAIMALAEQGVVGLDDPLAQHVDPVLAEISPGTSLRSLFGASADDMTVVQSVAMQLGIGDYDGGTFDDGICFDPSLNRLTHTPVEFLAEAAKSGTSCDPGECTRYSSASMTLGALVSMRHQPGRVNWTDFDARWPFPDSVRSVDLPDSVFLTSQMVRDVLKGPGYASPWDTSMPKQVVWEQSGSVMGVGGANLAAPTRDVAHFLWDLLGPAPKVVSAASVAKMLAPLGDAASIGKYGIGMQAGSVYESRYSKHKIGDFGTWHGHVGDVTGFATHEAFVYGPNASIAIGTNFDDGWGYANRGFLGDVMCNAVQAYCDTVEKTGRDLKCTPP